MPTSPPLHDVTIAFDLDGTLVDTAPDLVRALNACMDDFGDEAIPIDAVRGMIGQGARALIERAFARTGRPADAADIDRRLAHFLDVYAAGIANESKVFDGAVTSVLALKEKGARVTICTNKPQELTHRLLDALAIARHFDAVFCPQNVSARKPDPAHVRAAIAPAIPARALMIGDSEPDLHAARAARVPVVLMRHGYSIAPVDSLGADYVLDGFGGFDAMISTHFAIKNHGL